MPNTTVILIRHAEKLTWNRGQVPGEDAKALYVDNHLLSAKGYERAQALVGYFLNRAEVVELQERRPLGAVIAQAVDSGPDGWGRSRRPLETVEPLVRAWNAQPNARPLPLLEFCKKDWQALLEAIKGGQFEGQTVIVSWSHQQLPQLATGLGVPEQLVPRKWKGERFDVTWVVELSDGAAPTFKQFPQRLLYGDGDRIIE
ncbi:hypothetical protein HK105_201923 [Polyrhizophydium stewartii]|uniref:Phosphoglycerate mutase n=1 Tax=Polyrhizophydium stewartii TaxID=2732419 RepID=A0ABR4NG95_9FUNG|nr:hypothetical protein HK105_006446 [Polyrhizophydium stewartii]